MRLLFFIAFTVLVVLGLPAQEVMQLRSQLSRTKSDTAVSGIYYDLSSYYLNVNLDSAIYFADSSLAAAQRSGFIRYILNSRLAKAIALQNQGNTEDANVYFFDVLKGAEQNNFLYLKGKALNGIGNSFAAQGRLSEALPYFEQCLKLFKDVDERVLSTIYNNIGNIYYNRAFNSPGKDFSKAYEYYNKSLEIAYKYNIITQQVTTLSNLALTASDDNKPKEALAMLEKAFEISDKNNLQSEKIWIYHYKGRAYRDLKDYVQAEFYFKKSIGQALNLGNIDYASDGYYELSETYYAMDRYEDAYLNLARHKTIEDSLININTHEQLNELQTRYQTEKKQQQIELLELNANRDKWIKYSLIAVAVLVMISAIMFYSRYKLKAKSNQLLQEQNKIIQQKNKDITDSINYANLIQKALLPSEQELSQSFSKHFILNIPRDIVSGDFYWHYRKDNYSFFVVADCTGHGVPGAMMSTAGSSLLNQVVAEKNCMEPAEILNQLRGAVINLLKQNRGAGENRDGMDISLLRFNHAAGELIYAGANNPAYHVRNGHLTEYKADKQPIGYFSSPQPFTQTVIPVEKGDMVYLLSDGYADQFGGPDGKKLKYSRLKELLCSCAPLGEDEQKLKLGKEFAAWKGQLEQVDDVMLAGIRF